MQVEDDGRILIRADGKGPRARVPLPKVFRPRQWIYLRETWEKVEGCELGSDGGPERRVVVRGGPKRPKIKLSAKRGEELTRMEAQLEAVA